MHMILCDFLYNQRPPKYGFFKNRRLEKSSKSWNYSDGDMFHSIHALYHRCEGIQPLVNFLNWHSKSAMH